MLGLGLAVAGQHLGPVLRWLPHPRALGEDLDNFGSDFIAVLEGRDQSLSRPDMGSDMHTGTVAEGNRRSIGWPQPLRHAIGMLTERGILGSSPRVDMFGAAAAASTHLTPRSASRAATLSNTARALVKRPLIANVATVDHEGRPQPTPVWIDLDGDDLIFNTAKGRAKTANLEKNTHVAVSIVDPDDAYNVVVVRGSVEGTEEGADAHIDSLAKKYLDVDTYPMRRPGEVRVIYRVHADKWSCSRRTTDNP
jgi:PPOX class probable F420-dependent enzyme